MDNVQVFRRRLLSDVKRFYTRHFLTWGYRLTKLQLTFFALILGVVGGLLAVGYQEVLKYALKGLWIELPRLLHRLGTFQVLPEWTFLLVTPVVMSLLVCMGRALFPGVIEMGGMIGLVRRQGYTSWRNIPAVLWLTLASICSGSSVGPEAAVVLLASDVGSAFIPHVARSTESRRILTLCLQGGALAAFFNLPVAGALFVIEIQSRENLEYSEAVTPTVLASVVGVMLATQITGRSIGDTFVFSSDPSGGSLYLAEGMLVGVLGAVLASVLAAAMALPRLPLKRRAVGASAPLVGGVVIGVIAALAPATMFWSEMEIETVISNGKVPLPHTEIAGILPMMDSDGLYVWWAWGLCAGLKLFLLAVCLHTGYVGGIIFPLFYVGFTAASFIGQAVHFIPVPFFSLALAAAVEASVTRTPLGTSLALVTLRRMTNPMETAMLPGVLVAAYVAMLLTTDTVRILRPQDHRFGWQFMRQLQDSADSQALHLISRDEFDAAEALLQSPAAQLSVNNHTLYDSLLTKIDNESTYGTDEQYEQDDSDTAST